MGFSDTHMVEFEFRDQSTVVLPFRIFEAGHVEVSLNGERLILGIDYSIENLGGEGGCELILHYGKTKANDRIKAVRNIPLLQSCEIPEKLKPTHEVRKGGLMSVEEQLERIANSLEVIAGRELVQTMTPGEANKIIQEAKATKPKTPRKTKAQKEAEAKIIAAAEAEDLLGEDPPELTTADIEPEEAITADTLKDLLIACVRAAKKEATQAFLQKNFGADRITLIDPSKWTELKAKMEEFLAEHTPAA